MSTIICQAGWAHRACATLCTARIRQHVCVHAYACLYAHTYRYDIQCIPAIYHMYTHVYTYMCVHVRRARSAINVYVLLCTVQHTTCVDNMQCSYNV